VDFGVLSHLNGIEEDVNNKYELNEVIPQQIPVVVRSNDQLTHLLSREVSLFVLVFYFATLKILLFPHDHFMNFLASHLVHHYDDLDLFPD